MGRSVVILGSGGHARVVADACSSAGRSVAGFLGPAGDAAGASLLGDDSRLEDAAFVAGHEFIVGIGDQARRESLSRALLERGASLATVVHGSAVVSPSAQVGPGTLVCAGAVVNPGAVVERWVIVNTHATVDHDTRLADGVHVCPGATLAGDVRCGEGALIGAGATVIRGLAIGARATVGAGSVVIEDVAPGATVVGVPARDVERS